MRDYSTALRQICICIAAGLSVGLASAGTVTVTSVDPSRFSDAGSALWEKEAALDALTRHLQGLGERHLPADQTLQVEVLDLDLAGTLRYSSRAGRELRVLRGSADVPRIRLRYALESGGKSLQGAQETVTDLSYMRGIPRTEHADPLHYEKQMLERWFKERFVEGRAVAG